jgi:hypothetical protein
MLFFRKKCGECGGKMRKERGTPHEMQQKHQEGLPMDQFAVLGYADLQGDDSAEVLVCGDCGSAKLLRIM